MNTKIPDKIPDTEEAWETGELGRDATYAAVAETNDTEIDAAIDLQPISIRLNKSLIEDFKIIAGLNGLGYQTLMRQVLRRFADCEKKQILREMAGEHAKQQQADVKSTQKRRKVA